jgi:hypothetical protein
MLVGVVALTVARSSPRTSFALPVIVVVPVPSAAPKPIIFPVMVNAPIDADGIVVVIVIPA